MDLLTKAGKASSPDIVEVLFKSQCNILYSYPTLDSGILLTAGGSVWTEGSWVEIIPESTVDCVFQLQHVSVESANYDGVYELILAAGNVGEEQEICRRRFSIGKFATGKYMLPNEISVRTNLIVANTRISAKLACESSGKTAAISLSYNKY